MATMGVIPYNAIQTHGKLQVLQQSSTNNANNERRGEVIILRRKPAAIIGSTTKLPSATVGADNNNTSVNSKNAISASNVTNGNNGSNGSNTGKAPRGKRKGSMMNRSTPLVETSGGSSGGGGGGGGGAGMVRTQNPPPVAVARRNARERNRVKQVNNGFATLRQHIPASVASAYTSTEHTGRGASKKLSKVETLRMAVDYIRSLQQMLSIDDDGLVNDNSPVSLLTASPSPSASSHNPSLNQNSYVSFEDDNEHDASSVLLEDSSSSCMDTSPASASPSVRVVAGVGVGGGQYPRGGNLITLVGTHDERKTYAYQYECDENLAPLQLGPGAPISTLGRMTLITSGQRASGDLLSMGHLHDSKHDVYQQSSPIQNAIRHPTASLSPGVYSDQSMSPSELDNNSSTTKLDYLPEFSSSLKSPIMNSSLGVVVHPSQTYHTLQQLTAVKKEEVGDEMDDHGDGNHMVDMMTWWEHDQRIRENSP